MPLQQLASKTAFLKVSFNLCKKSPPGSGLFSSSLLAVVVSFEIFVQFSDIG